MVQRVQMHCRFLLGKNNNETYVSAVKYCKFMFLEFSKAKVKTPLFLYPWSMLKKNERTIHAQFVLKIFKTDSASTEIDWF